MIRPTPVMSCSLRSPAGHCALSTDTGDGESAYVGLHADSDCADVSSRPLVAGGGGCTGASMHDSPMRHRSCPASGARALVFAALLAAAAALVGSRAPSSGVSAASLQADSSLRQGQASEDSPPKAGTCEEYGGKTVILVTTSVDFNDMFTNWFYYARPFLDDTTQQVVVIAHDEESVQTLGELAANLSAPSFVVIYVQSLDSGENVSERRLADFNTTEYGDIVTQRALLILHFLNLGCDVLYSDIDMVYLKDPITPILAGEPHDLYFASDSPNGSWSNFCSCFIYARPSNTTKSFMTTWADLNRGKTRNQPDFNKAMRLHNKTINESLRIQNFSVLPQSEHPPGRLADNFSDPIVLHANFLTGKARKTQFFKNRSIWHPGEIYKS